MVHMPSLEIWEWGLKIFRGAPTLTTHVDHLLFIQHRAANMYIIYMYIICMYICVYMYIYVYVFSSILLYIIYYEMLSIGRMNQFCIADIY